MDELLESGRTNSEILREIAGQLHQIGFGPDALPDIAYDEAMGEETNLRGFTHPSGEIRISARAFDSDELLVSTILHELIHAEDFETGAASDDLSQEAVNEMEAYLAEIENASMTGVSGDDLGRIFREMETHVGDLTPAGVDRFSERLGAAQEFVSDMQGWPSCQQNQCVPIGVYALNSLPDSVSLNITASGFGYYGESISIALRNDSDDCLGVKVEPGTVFEPDDETVQTMIAAGGERVTLAAGTSSTALLRAFCGESHDSAPGVATTFHLAGVSERDDIQSALAEVRARRAFDVAGQQLVWSVTDEISVANPAVNGQIVDLLVDDPADPMPTGYLISGLAVLGVAAVSWVALNRMTSRGSIR